MTRYARSLPVLAALVVALPALAACSDDGTAEPEAGGAAPTTVAPEPTSAEATTTEAEESAPTTDAPVAETSTDLGAALDLAMEELVAMPGGPPAVVSVVQIGEERTVRAVGLADVETGSAPEGDFHMRLASAAKAFSGATALALVDQGVLSLDDTIGERLPELPAAWADVTLRQLLSHTSGMPDFAGAPAFAEAVGASLDVAPPPEELLGFAADQPLNFPPGTEYRYSNSDNIAVGLMVQAATGRSYAEVLQEEVLVPLGLEGTSLPEGVEIPEPFIHGYVVGDGEPLEDVSLGLASGWAWASGGIISTPDDLNTFIRAYVSGELWSAETRAEQQSLFIPGGESGPPGPGQNSATLAMFRYETPCGTVYGHTGNTVGFTQFAVASPDGERSATVSINLQRNANSEGQAAAVYDAMRRVEQAAICLALAEG